MVAEFGAFDPAARRINSGLNRRDFQPSCDSARRENMRPRSDVTAICKQ